MKLYGLVIWLVAAAPALAADFVVNTTDDTVDASVGDELCADASGNCSLRAAIQQANALNGMDTITFENLDGSPDRYELTIAGDFEDAAATGDLDITDDVTITGNGATETIIDAGGDGVLEDRVLEIGGAITVEIDGVTITGGRQPSPSPGTSVL